MIIHKLQNYALFCAAVLRGLQYQTLLLNIEKHSMYGIQTAGYTFHCCLIYTYSLRSRHVFPKAKLLLAQHFIFF